MKILALDTAGEFLTVAVGEGATLLGEVTMKGGKGGMSHLTGMVDHLCRATTTPLESFDLMVVTIGPGTFTGVRVGLGFAKGLGRALSIPIIPVSALEMEAASAPSLDLPVLSLIDARKGELYAALYTPMPSLTPLCAETVVAVDRVDSLVSTPVVAVGTGALQRRTIIEPLLPPSSLIVAPLRPRSFAPLFPLLVERHHSISSVDPVTLFPRYLRAPEAEKLHP